VTEPLTAAEDELRRFHWYQLAVELGQKEDFLALIAAERRDAVEEYKRTHGQRLSQLRGLMTTELEGLTIRLPDGRTVGLNEEIAAHIAEQILTAESLADFIPAVCTCPPGREGFDYGKAGTHHNPVCPLWMVP